MNKSLRGSGGSVQGSSAGKGSRSLQIVTYSGKSFIDGFNKHLLTTYYVPGTVLDVETQ